MSHAAPGPRQAGGAWGASSAAATVQGRVVRPELLPADEGRQPPRRTASRTAELFGAAGSNPETRHRAYSHELTSAPALVGADVRVASSETHRQGRCVHCPASRPVAVTDDGNCIGRWRRTGAKPAARAVQARPVADATRALVVERSSLTHTLEAVCLERVCPTYAPTYGATDSGRYTSHHTKGEV
jgi:hypothetical protein